MTSVRSSFVGRDVEAVERTIESRNPADPDDIVATVDLSPVGAFGDAARAVRAGQARWEEVPRLQRGRTMLAVARAAEARESELAELIVRETGKPRSQAAYEAAEFAHTCNFYGSEASRPDEPALGSGHPGTHLFTFRAPVGVLGVVTPLNYPVALPAWAIAPALVYGNAVLWKPSEEAPAIAQLVLDLFIEGGVPSDALGVVHAAAATTFDGLSRCVEDELLDKLVFTGHSDVTRELSALGARMPQAPALTGSGNNIVILAEDADIDLAVAAVRYSGYGANQGCTTVSTVLAHAGVRERFVERLEAELLVAPVGDPQSDVLYGPVFSPRYAARFDGVLALIEPHHRARGSSAVGRIDTAQPRAGFVGDPDAGSFYHPTLLDDVRPDDAILREEAMGPLVNVVEFDDIDAAFSLANTIGAGAFGAVFTASAATAFQSRKRLDAAILGVNRPPSQAGEARAPAGGEGRSGNGGRWAGPWAIEQVTRWQTMSWRYTDS